MKYIRKRKSVNEGYFKSVDDIKANPEKYKTSTIGDTARKIVEDEYIPRILYYLYMCLGKYFYWSWDNPLLGGKDDFGRPRDIGIFLMGLEEILTKDVVGNTKKYDSSKKVLPVSDEVIKNWIEHYNNVYFDNNHNFVKLSPIKNIEYNDAEFVCTLRTFQTNSYNLTFFDNRLFDVFPAIEREVSKLVKVPIKIKLVYFASRQEGEIPFPTKGDRSSDRTKSIIIVGDVDFEEMAKFISRYESVQDPNNCILKELLFFNVDIPSLSYLPQFPCKFSRIVFDSCDKSHREGTFKYNLDSIGNFEKILAKTKYRESLDDEWRFSEIVFEPQCFNFETLPNITNGIITAKEIERAYVLDTNCSYAPYQELDTSPRIVQQVKLQ